MTRTEATRKQKPRLGDGRVGPAHPPGVVWLHSAAAAQMHSPNHHTPPTSATSPAPLRGVKKEKGGKKRKRRCSYPRCFATRLALGVSQCFGVLLGLQSAAGWVQQHEGAKLLLTSALQAPKPMGTSNTSPKRGTRSNTTAAKPQHHLRAPGDTGSSVLTLLHCSEHLPVLGFWLLVCCFCCCFSLV